MKLKSISFVINRSSKFHVVKQWNHVRKDSRLSSAVRFLLQGEPGDEAMVVTYVHRLIIVY